MNIITILQQFATTQAELPAIIDTHKKRSRTTTFAELEKASAITATLLQQKGLQPGDTVLVFHPMSAELYIILAALFRLGLIAMFLDPGVGKNHINDCCNLYTPKALIASSRAYLLCLQSQALQRIPLKFAIGCPIPGAISLNYTQQAPYDISSQIFTATKDSPALLTFTSGSTGKPKAALRTHGFLLAQHQALVNTLQLQAQQLDLTTLPIFVLANLASGLTSLIPNANLRKPGAINPAPVIAQILTHQPSQTVASPGFLSRLTAYCLQHSLTLPSLQKIFVGGAPVMPNSLIELQKIAPNSQITTVYGSTEAEPIAYSHHQTQTEDVTTTLTGGGLLVGKPVDSIQLRILPQCWGKPISPHTHAEFTAACQPIGTPGEIVVSGNHVLSSYLNGDGNEETKFTVEETSWHRTGDTGYIDNQGRLWLLGRCIGCIDDNYGTLYPLAVEGIMQNHPDIRYSAVILHQGQRTLVVELNKPKSQIDWKSVKDSLENMHIQKIKVCKKFPLDKRHNAKVDYPALLKLSLR
ncbi:peptide synthase [Calothrix sp. PCC 7716]|nr:peptide synthase [Calothrix sp. PCC 7716]